MKKASKPSQYFVWIIRFIRMSIIWGMLYSVLMISMNKILGIIGIVIFSFLLLTSFYILRGVKAKITKDIDQRLLTLGEMRKEMFSRAPLPMITINIQGDIWWYNQAFKQIIGDDASPLGVNIRSIWPEIQVEQLPKDNTIFERDIVFEESIYIMYCELVKVEKQDEADYHYNIYFIDQTKRVALEKQIKNKRCIIGIMSIDNYTEIMQDVDEVKRPMLTAIIDRKIHRWLKEEDIIIRKFERDKYMIVLSYELLSKIEESKFAILDDMRSTQMGNKLPITMSIGIGENTTSLIGSMEEARAALDLALGRGGDQAVIKNQDKYTFYGGKTKEVEKSTRVKARMKAYAFKELIQEADNILIMGHKNMDMDCLGAAMGVYRAAVTMDKKAQIVLNEPTLAIQMLYDRIREHVEYDHLFISSQDAEYQINGQTLLVIVDVHRGSYLEHPKLLDMCEKVVVFDHHRRSTDYIDDAVLTYYESYISSTCEMIAEILQYFGEKVKLTNIEADALLAGITIDTKNFIFKAGVRTFEAAAFLRRNGADSTRVRMLFQDDLESYKARAVALKNAELYKDTIAITSVQANIENAFVLAAQTADDLLNIRGIIASFVMAEQDNMISISARSHGEVNVQIMMEMLGGGGHQTVAGAQIQDSTIEEVTRLIKNVINEYSEEGE